MITAVDTSVLLDIFASDPKHLLASQNAVRKCMRDGRLVVCEVVLAELRPCFPDTDSLEEALDTLEVDFSPITREAAFLAGESWKRYRESGGKRDHLIPDFLIAAHAIHSADRFLTRDRGFYRKWFSGLKMMEP
jgi:predicted nucleic acid-binding protein